MVRHSLLLGGVLALFLPLQYALGSIVGSEHDLSGGLATEICVFCHTPHNANTDLDQDGTNDGTVAGVASAPLWNRSLTDVSVFQMYTSSTMNADCSATPSPVSLACLSCHDEYVGGVGSDGAVSAGGIMGFPGGEQHQLVNVPNVNPTSYVKENGTCGTGVNSCHDTLTGLSSGEIRWIGPNLSNDHPISIVYADAVAEDPTIYATPGGGVKLFNGRVECPSCHNPHDNTTYKPFLRVAITGSTLCYRCHNK
ncbi:Cytochrome c family protein [hydrothermal vent metagenome]|uniref:Cytochrome c family protein n=1 Tax=hydrothermal vent metagenome TaxID=652676 RepID=A0A3B1AQQ6_9ZZZZ